jgi:hypothetical protein
MTTELTTTSIVSLFDTTKEQRSSFVQDLISRVTEGHEDPVKVHYAIKCMEEIIKSITTDPLYKNCVLTEAEKHGKKFAYRNSEIQIKEAGVKYDYTKCGDIEYDTLIKQKEQLDTVIKDREIFLKTVPASGMNLLIDDEVVQIYPPSKSSTTTVQVTLK